MNGMDWNMIAYCGSYCGVSEWKDRIGCQGCKAMVEKCSGACETKPNAVFPKDGGARLRKLQHWRAGEEVYERLVNAAQKQMKNLDKEEK